mmetsp:Transcript_790/g.1972  ORF Transcript_790/g.1972 Transcript_790/m.1972 type:complete len:134 (+) Transcript_790:595-996(+)
MYVFCSVFAQTPLERMWLANYALFTFAAKPEEVTQGDSGEKTVADKRIETMDSTLRKEKNVSLYDIAVDQGSFSKSVENLFYFSFLVKDGRARVAADKIGYQATSIDPAERARQSTGEESRQVILRCETIPLR